MTKQKPTDARERCRMKHPDGQDYRVHIMVEDPSLPPMPDGGPRCRIVETVLVTHPTVDLEDYGKVETTAMVFAKAKFRGDRVRYLVEPIWECYRDDCDRTGATPDPRTARHEDGSPVPFNPWGRRACVSHGPVPPQPDVVVSFKDEDEVDGVPVGPVWITDVDGEAKDQGWMTKPEAITVAKQHGTELETA